MEKFDKTQKNIKVGQLENDDRDDLFHKFVDAGGKVVDDKGEVQKKKKPAVFDKKKQLANKKIIDTQKKRAKSRSLAQRKNVDTRKAAAFTKNTLIVKKPNLLQSITQRLMIRIRLNIMKVTDFSATRFNNKFFHVFNTQYKMSFMGIQMLFYEIFKQDQEIEYGVINELEDSNTLYFELIEMMSNVYNETEFIQIVQPYLKNPDAAFNVMDYKNSFLSLFRKVYILKSYQQNLLDAFDKSLTFHMKMSKKKSSDYSPKRKKIKNDLFIIFEKLLPALYWLFCNYQGRIIPLGTSEIDDILGITLADKPGSKRKKKEISPSGVSESEKTEEAVVEEKNEEQEEAKEDEETKEEKISNNVKIGLQLMKYFNLKNISKLRKIFDKSKTFSSVRENDKMLTIYLLLEEFDMNYAFLLTTNKIKYSIEYTGKGEVDYKEKLLLLYNDIRKCLASLSSYVNAYDIYYNLKKEKPESNDRYIEYTKKLSDFLNKREQAGHNAKIAVMSFMDNTSRVLRTLVDDIGKEKKIIENPEDVLKFDVSIDKNKRLNNKTIYKALAMAYCFTSAFVYRLSLKGDLSGNLEFDLLEKKKGIIDTEKEPEKQQESDTEKEPEKPQKSDAEKPEETSQEENQDQEQGKSILNELDDLF